MCFGSLVSEDPKHGCCKSLGCPRWGGGGLGWDTVQQWTHTAGVLMTVLTRCKFIQTCKNRLQLERPHQLGMRPIEFALSFNNVNRPHHRLRGGAKHVRHVNIQYEFLSSYTKNVYYTTPRERESPISREQIFAFLCV